MNYYHSSSVSDLDELDQGKKKTFKHYIFRSSSDCSIACTVVVFVVNLQLKMLDLKQHSDKYV